jgi:hypothetical protein
MTSPEVDILVRVRLRSLDAFIARLGAFFDLMYETKMTQEERFAVLETLNWMRWMRANVAAVMPPERT